MTINNAEAAPSLPADGGETAATSDQTSFDFSDVAGDYFTVPEAEGGPAEEELAPDAEQSTATPEVAPTQEVPAGQETPPVTTQEDVMRGMLDQITQLSQQTAAPAGASADAPAQADPFGFQPYTNLDEGLVAAIRSDDPQVAQQGFTTFANAVTKNVIDSVRTAIEQHYVPQVAQFVQQNDQTRVVQQNAQQQADQFYADNPHLNNPEGRQLTTFVTQQILAEKSRSGQPVQALTSELQKEIASRVATLAPALNPQPAPAPAAKSAPFVAGKSSRPAPAAALGVQEQALADLI